MNYEPRGGVPTMPESLNGFMATQREWPWPLSPKECDDLVVFANNQPDTRGTEPTVRP